MHGRCVLCRRLGRTCSPDCHRSYGDSCCYVMPPSKLPSHHPPVHRPNISVAKLRVVDSRLIAISADRAVACHRWLTPKDQPALTFSGVGETLAPSIEPDASPPRLLGTPFAADLDSSQCYGVLHGGQVGRLSCCYNCLMPSKQARWAGGLCLIDWLGMIASEQVCWRGCLTGLAWLCLLATGVLCIQILSGAHPFHAIGWI